MDSEILSSLCFLDFDALSKYFVSIFPLTSTQVLTEKKCPLPFHSGKPPIVTLFCSERNYRHAHSHARTLTRFPFFPADFRGKERLLEVYGST